jgi:hypothetical protein
VAVEQRSVDVSITCLAPGGNEIFWLDSSVIGDPETVELIADIAGLYRLRITPAPHSPGGEYEIALREIQPSTERHRTRIAAARAFAERDERGHAGQREGFRRAIGHEEKALSYWRTAMDRSEEALHYLRSGC